MEEDQLLHLLAKKMGKAASDEELAALEALLEAHPDVLFLKRMIDAVESNKDYRKPISEEELTSDNWYKIEKVLNRKDEKCEGEVFYPWINPKRSKRLKVLRWAAVWGGMILLLLGGYLWFNNVGNRGGKLVFCRTHERIIRSVHHAPRKHILPDGSEVWLNSDSYLRYSENIKDKKREVFLEGEAYFNVKHDPDHPFIVHAAGIDIKVLGTAFNVEAYSNEELVEATLINGKIKVELSEYPDKSLILKPNEKLSISTKKFKVQRKRIHPLKRGVQRELKFKIQELASPKSVNPMPEIAWMEDRLVFQNERFDEIARSLERRFGVKIIFETPSLKRERLNGIFKNETIQKALRILQMTTPFSYELKGDTVYLKEEE